MTIQTLESLEKATGRIIAARLALAGLTENQTAAFAVEELLIDVRDAVQAVIDSAVAR